MSAFRDTNARVDDATESTARNEFDARVDQLLQTTWEVARALISVHQAAMAMLVERDWTQARKYISLSNKYEQWKEFTMPARGIGLHALVVADNESLYLTETKSNSIPPGAGSPNRQASTRPCAACSPSRSSARTALNTGFCKSRTRSTGATSPRTMSTASNASPTRPRSGSTPSAR
jgi:hypothetical protein